MRLASGPSHGLQRLSDVILVVRDGVCSQRIDFFKCRYRFLFPGLLGRIAGGLGTFEIASSPTATSLPDFRGKFTNISGPVIGAGH